ncbi:MAG: TRAP transporter small permease [Alphaproteobacteria bacterium]|nr:TRAP transporter small permease [Alphaproteobacteria bacterium]
MDSPRTGAVRLFHDGLDRIITAGSWLATAALVGVLLMYWIEIFLRYFMNAPTSWASDFTAFTLCAAIFLMMPEITRTGGHVAVTLLTDLLPQGPAIFAKRLIALAGAFACLFAAYISLLSNISQFTGDISTVSTIAVPKWWISSFITFGLAVSALEFLRQGFGARQFSAATSIG